ncbi:MAG: phosphotransferase [Candidatus Kariarchaeaceae archaeon]
MNRGTVQDLMYWYDVVENNFPIKLIRDHCKVIQKGLRLIILLQTSEDKFILRVLNEDQEEKDKLVIILETLHHLNNSEIPITYPYKWNNGSFIIEVERSNILYYCTIYKFIYGESILPLTEVQQYELGKVLASFHNTLGEVDPNKFKKWDINDTIQLIEKYFGKKREDMVQKLYEVRRKVAEIYDSLEQKPPFAIVHGDLHNYNIHFHHNKPTIMDFDGISQNYIAFDIAVFIGIERFLLIERNYEYTFPNYQRLIEGYNSIRTLNSNELQLLPIFQIERFIFLLGFWVMILEKGSDEEYENKLMRRIFFVLSMFDDLFYIWETNPSLYLDSEYMKGIYQKINSIDYDKSN